MIQPCHLQRPPRSAKSPVPHRDCRNFIFITSISLHTTSGCHVVPIFHGCRLVRSVTSTSRLSSGLFIATISIRIITLVRSLGLFLNLYSCVITRILIRNQCEYTRSLFPLYTLGCNMYTYSKQLLCLNKTYSIYERDMKLL
ncbi:hypothetical protein HanPI659440_Chr10g0396301 [Helianthus annuus]|nr:hypothetical protein HanPI659440_Chr10g0396301 [Helianthus annuus]